MEGDERRSQTWPGGEVTATQVHSGGLAHARGFCSCSKAKRGGIVLTLVTDP